MSRTESSSSSKPKPQQSTIVSSFPSPFTVTVGLGLSALTNLYTNINASTTAFQAQYEVQRGATTGILMFNFVITFENGKQSTHIVPLSASPLAANQTFSFSAQGVKSVDVSVVGAGTDVGLIVPIIVGSQGIVYCSRCTEVCHKKSRF